MPRAGDARLRQARPADYDDIISVADQWWGRDVAATLPRLFLDHFASSSLVVEDDDGLAGFLVGFVSQSQPLIAYVHFAGVRPGRRRTGLARRLYAEFADAARNRGCDQIHAITSPGNEASIRFHRALGFQVTAAVAGHNGPGRPMVTFRLPLDAPS